MRKSIILTLLCLTVGVLGFSQTVKVDANGNFHQVKDTSVASLNLSSSSLTGKTYTDSKGVSYPAYLSSTGKLFVVRTSGKTGNKYKQYLKVSN